MRLRGRHLRHMLGRRSPRRDAVAAVSDLYGRDLEGCLARIAGTVAEARARGARLIVFPESALGGYPSASAPPPPALDRPGAHVERLAEIAGDAVLCLGYTEAGAGGSLFSSALCVSGDGVLGHHRKVHIPPSERDVFEPGEGFAAFDTPVGRVGMLLCYDKVFPEAARALSLDGAQIIASMAAWPVSRAGAPRRVGRDPQVRHFNLLDEARALENQVLWVSANLCGRLGELRFPGQAKVVGPDGGVLAATRAKAGIALARIDALATVGSARRAISHLADRRPEAYPERPRAVAIAS